MNSAVLQPQSWPRTRLLVAALLIFAVQLGLIFWLSDKNPLAVRSAHNPPQLRVAGAGSAEWLALADPTLFALPHANGFSGPAWMSIPPPPVRTFSWSEPPRWLNLSTNELVADFNCFVATNDFEPWQTLAAPEPVLGLPEIQPLTVPAESIVRIEGDLAQRPLVTRLAGRSWAGKDLLSKSIVQLLVDRDGRPASVTLLRPGSGSQAADNDALQQARDARFAPRNGSAATPLAAPDRDLTWGRLVFEWHTLPESATNTTSASAAHP